MVSRAGGAALAVPGSTLAGKKSFQFAPHFGRTREAFVAVDHGPISPDEEAGRDDPHLEAIAQRHLRRIVYVHHHEGHAPFASYSGRASSMAFSISMQGMHRLEWKSRKTGMPALSAAYMASWEGLVARDPCEG